MRDKLAYGLDCPQPLLITEYEDCAMGPCTGQFSNAVDFIYLLLFILLNDICHIASPQQTLPAFSSWFCS